MTEISQPQLIKGNGQTRVGAVVNLDDGLYDLKCVRKFVEEARKYKRRICVRSDDGVVVDLKKEGYNLGAEKGEKLEFIVAGTDRGAERIALRLYSGVTSESSNSPYFGRFEDFDFNSLLGHSLLFGTRRC
jgi:phosphotransferase system HPr-like phosphotransfer protein